MARRLILFIYGCKNGGIYMQEIYSGKVILKLDVVVRSQGVSINKLACRAEMQRTQLKAYMRNDIQRVDLNILARLCYALDCNLDDIIEYIPPEK